MSKEEDGSPPSSPPLMQHDALGFKFPLTADEQAEMRGALLSALARIEILEAIISPTALSQETRIEILETRINELNYIIQTQIEELSKYERIAPIIRFYP
jgi:hypothetical protein